MSMLYNNIELLCHEKGINITIMCAEAGVSRSSLTDLKKGRKQSLSLKAMTKIANYFDVPLDYFKDEKDAKKVVPFSDDEEWNEYIDMYKSFSPSDRDLVLGFMKGLAAKNESDK